MYTHDDPDVDLVVYTAAFGRRPPEPAPEIQGACIFFSDQALTSPGWEVVQVPLEGNARETSRKYKLLSHRVFPNTPRVLWIDCNMILKGDPSEGFVRLCDCPLGTFRNPYRDCLYEEAEFCIRKKLTHEGLTRSQISRYREEGMPEKNGLPATGVLFRKTCPEIEAFNELWYEELQKGSIRDQVSFPYVEWRTGTKVYYFDESVYGNKYTGNRGRH